MNECVAKASRPDEVVIDFVHLARQTSGDQDLELQLLDLFVERSAHLLDKIAKAEPLDRRRDYAHGLKGSALAIGAKRVARAAAAYEGMAMQAAGESTLAAAYETLAKAVVEARGTIASVR